MSDEIDNASRGSNLSATKRSLLEKLLQQKPAGVSRAEIVPTPAELLPAPLSFAQSRLWFLDQLAPGASNYNLSRKLLLKGELHVASLERSLAEIVSRHEILRTVFMVAGDEPVQHVAEAQAFRLEELDLSGWPEAEREEELRRQAMAHARQSFDLQRGPLLRAALLRVAGDEHVLLLTIHHIISDGQSVDILFRELAARYEAFATGRHSPLPELPVQYGDYAVWQRRQLSGDAWERHLAYWREHLKGAPAAIELPTDKPRPATQSYLGSRLNFTIEPEVAEGLRELARREGATLFMLMLAAFNVLLSRYSGQSDICVGVPASNRTPREVEGLIGFFVNTLVMRTQPEGSLSFREFLRRVREVALSAYAHQDVPFERLVEELQPERDLSRSPLFQTMFAFEDAPVKRWTMGGVEVAAEVSESGSAKFDLALDVTESERGLLGTFEYNTDLFERETLERMSRHFVRLLQGISTQPDLRLFELPLLSDGERRRLLFEINDTRSDYRVESCVHEMFEAQAEQTPDALAVVSANQELSYAELNRRANRLAHYLRARGVGAEERVGICLERSVELIVALLGVLKAGGAYVPLDPEYPQDRLSYMLRDAEVRVLLTQERLIASLPEQSVEAVCVDSSRREIDRESDLNPGIPTRAGQMAYVMYTSGSTGTPKAVMIEHGSVAGYSHTARRLFSLEAKDRCLQFASICFDTSVEEIFPCLLAGGSLILRSTEMLQSVEHFLGQCAQRKISVLDLPTAYWHEIVSEMERGDLSMPPSIRLVIIGGERVHPERLTTWHQRQGVRPALINTYGPTEATVSATGADLSGAGAAQEARGREVSIGRPLTNKRTYILDGHGEPVPPGVSGELYIGGEGLARGYFKRPELTAEKFVPDPFGGEPGSRLYRTGDVARHLADGSLEFVGRIDRQVKVRGYRVEPGEIEAALRRCAGVREAAVVVPREDGAMARLVAYYTTEGDAVAADADALRWELRGSLPEHMVPSAFVAVDAMPLTVSGKIDGQALSKLVAEPAAGGAYVAPRTQIESLLAGLWAEALGVERVGVNDNFFNSGGHSLLAARLLARVLDVFHVRLSLQRLFERPTVAELAESIEDAGREGEADKTHPISRVSREQETLLSFNQEGRLFREWWEGIRSAPSIPFQFHAALRLSGTLDLEALRQSLDEIVRRHEALRTTFQAPQGILSLKILNPLIDRILSSQMVQQRLRKVSKKKVWKSSFFKPIINSGVTVPIRTVDLMERGEADREAEVQRVIVEEIERAIDYARDPLLRATLMKLDEQEHVLLLTLHHLACDGWSQQLVLRELGALYAAYSAKSLPTLPEVALQSADFAHWQREQLQGENLERLVAYWQKRYAGFPLTPELELPFALPQPAVRSYRGATEGLTLSPELHGSLKALCRRQGVTMYMLLLAGFIVLLYRYTRRERIGLITVFANRGRAETHSLVGWLANVQVFNANLSGDPRFLDFLKVVRVNALEDHAHEEIPYSFLFGELLRLTEGYKMPRRMFDASYVSFDLRFEDEPHQMPGLAVSAFDVPARFADEALSMLALETRDRLRININYSTERFDSRSITRALSDFQNLLENISANPEARLSSLSDEQAD